METLFNQYNKIKPKYSDAIVLLHSEDNYITFDNDAKLLAQVLDVDCYSRVLTKGSTKSILISKFKEFRFDEHLENLVKLKDKVAVCENVTNGK